MSDNRRGGRGRGRGYGRGRGRGQFNKPSHRGSWRRRNFNNTQDHERDGQTWENTDQVEYWDEGPVRGGMSPRWDEHSPESGARDREYNAVYYEDELSQEEGDVLRGEVDVDEIPFRENDRVSQDREVRDRDHSPYYRSHWADERDIRERKEVDDYGNEEYTGERQRWGRTRWNKEDDREFRDDNQETERMDEGWSERSYHDDSNSYDGNNRHEKRRKYNKRDFHDERNMDVHRDRIRDHDGDESHHDYDNQRFRDDYDEHRNYDDDNRDRNVRRDYDSGDRETDDFGGDRRQNRYNDNVDDLQYDQVSPEIRYDNVSPEHNNFPDDDRSSGHHRSHSGRDRNFDRKSSRRRENRNYIKGRELSQERTPSPIREGDLLPVMNQDIPPDIALQEGQIVIGPDGQLPPGVPIMIDPGLGPHIIPPGALVGDNISQVLVPFSDAPVENVSLDNQSGQETDEPRGFRGRGRGRGYNRRHNRGRGRGRGFNKFQRRDNQRNNGMNEPPAQNDVERMEQVPLPGAGPIMIEPGMVQMGMPEMIAPAVGPGIPLASMAGPMPVIVDPSGNVVQQVFVPLQGVNPNLPPAMINVDQRDQEMLPDREQRDRSWDKDLERQGEDQRHWDDRQRNRRDDRDSRPKDDRRFNRNKESDRQRDQRYNDRRDDDKYKGGRLRDDRGQSSDRHRDTRQRDEKHGDRREDDKYRRDGNKHSQQSRRHEDLHSDKERWSADRHSPKRSSHRSADSQDKHRGNRSSKDKKSEDFSKQLQDVISKQKKTVAKDDQAMISLLKSALSVLQDKVRKSDSKKKVDVSSKSGSTSKSRDSSESRAGSKRQHASAADRADAKKPRVEQAKSSSKHPLRKEGSEHDNKHDSRQSTSSRASSISAQESKHKDSREHSDMKIKEDPIDVKMDSSTIKNLSEKLESVLEKQRKQGEKIDNSMVMLLKSALDVAKKRTGGSGEKAEKEEKPSATKQPPKPVKFNIKSQEKEAEIQKSVVQESWQIDDIDSEEENYTGDEEDKTMEESLKVRSSELLQGKKSEQKPPPVKLDITQIDEPKEEGETTIIKRSKLPGKGHLRKRGEETEDDIDNEQAVVMSMKEKKKLIKEKKTEQDKPQTTEQSQTVVRSVGQAQVGSSGHAQIGSSGQAPVGFSGQAQVGSSGQAQVEYVQQQVNTVQQPVQQPIQQIPVQQPHPVQPLQQPWGAGAVRQPVSLPQHPSQAVHQIQTVSQVPRPTISYSQPPPLVTQSVITAQPVSSYPSAVSSYPPSVSSYPQTVSSYPPPNLQMPQNMIQNQQSYVAVQHPQVVQQRPQLVAPHPLVPRPPPSVVNQAMMSQPTPQMVPPLGTVTTQVMPQMPSVAVAGGQQRPPLVQQQPLVMQQPQMVPRPPVIMQPVAAPQPTPHITSQPAVSYPTTQQTSTPPASLPSRVEGVSDDLLAIQQKALETLRKEKMEEEQKKRQQQQQQQAMKTGVPAPVNPVTNIRPNQQQALRPIAPVSVAPYMSQPRLPLQATQPVSSYQQGTSQYRGPAPSQSTNKSSFPDSSVSRAPVKYDSKQQIPDTKNSKQEKKLYTAAELLERITAAKAAAQAKEKAQSTMTNIMKGHKAKKNLNVINTSSNNKNTGQLKTSTAGQQGVAKTSVVTAGTPNKGITANKKNTPKPLWKPEPSQAKEEKRGGDEVTIVDESASIKEFKKTAENIIKQIPTLDHTRKPAVAKTGRQQSNLSRIPTNPKAMNVKQNTSTGVLSNLYNNPPPLFSRPPGLQNMPRPGEPRFDFPGSFRPGTLRFGIPNNQNIAGPRTVPPGATALPPPTLAFPNILSSVSRPIFPAGVPPVPFPNQPQQGAANTQPPPSSSVSLVPYTSSPPRDSSKKSQNVTQTNKSDTAKGQDVSSRRKSPSRRRDSSPSRKSRSPTNHKRDTSRRRSGSPDQRHISPAQRSRSPNQRHEGTTRRSRSPYRRLTDSPRRRSGSLDRRDESPRRRSPGYEQYRRKSPSRRSPDLFYRRGSPIEHYQFGSRPYYDSPRPYPYDNLSPLRDGYRHETDFAYDSYRRFGSPPPRMHYYDDRLEFSPVSRKRYSSPPGMASDYYGRAGSPDYRPRDRSPGPYRGRSLSPRRYRSPPRMSPDFNKRHDLSPRREYSPNRRYGSPPLSSYGTRKSSPGSSTYRRQRSLSPRDRRRKSPSKHGELSPYSSHRHRELSPPTGSHKHRSPSPRSESYRQEYEYKTRDPTPPSDKFKQITEPSNQKSKTRLSDQYRRSLSPIYRKSSQKRNESNVVSNPNKQDSSVASSTIKNNMPATSSDSGNTRSSSEKLPGVLADLFKNVEATRNIGYKPMSKSMADLLNRVPAPANEQKPKTTYPAGILKKGSQQKVETDATKLPQTGALSSIQEAYKEPTGVMPNLFEKLSAWLPGFGQGQQKHESPGHSEGQGQNVNPVQGSLHSPSVSQPHTFDHPRYLGDARNPSSVSTPGKRSTGMEDSYESFLDVIGFQRNPSSQDAGPSNSGGPNIPGLDFFGDGNKNQSYGSEKPQQNYMDMYTTKQTTDAPGNIMPVSSSSSSLFFDRPAVSYNRPAVFPSAARLQQILRK